MPNLPRLFLLLSFSFFTAVSHIVMPPSHHSQLHLPLPIYSSSPLASSLAKVTSKPLNPNQSSHSVCHFHHRHFNLSLSHFRSMVSSHRVTACLSVPYLSLFHSPLSSSDELTCWRTEAAAAAAATLEKCLSLVRSSSHSLTISFFLSSTTSPY